MCFLINNCLSPRCVCESTHRYMLRWDCTEEMNKRSIDDESQPNSCLMNWLTTWEEGVKNEEDWFPLQTRRQRELGQHSHICGPTAQARSYISKTKCSWGGRISTMQCDSVNNSAITERSFPHPSKCRHNIVQISPMLGEGRGKSRP